MAVVGVPSSSFVNTFVAPGRFLPEVLAPQISRQSPLEQPPSINVERLGRKMRGINSVRELVSQAVDRVNGALGQFKVGVGINVESRKGQDRIIVQETASRTSVGELSTRQLFAAHVRTTDATNIPGPGLPSGLFVNKAL